jgi:hypothetical protein
VERAEPSSLAKSSELPPSPSVSPTIPILALPPSSQEPIKVPEPGTVAGLAAVAFIAAGLRRRKSC